MKQKKFTIHYHVDGVYEATIPADSLSDALKKANEMTKEQLDATPGTVMDEQIRITAVFE